jgi:hypothetical protein
MTFKHDSSWENLEKTLEAQLPIKEAWNKIIDFHAQIFPSDYWTELRQLDVAAEQEEIKDWLTNLVLNKPLPEQVVALWIGITKLLDDDANEVCTIYLSGADSYDQEDIDWATEPTYEPENKYGVLDVLNAIENIIEQDSVNYSFLDWILPLAYCALTLDEIFRNKLDSKLFLQSQNKLFTATGHDSGDYLNLSPIE